MTGCSGLIKVVLVGADLANHGEDANDLGVLKAGNGRTPLMRVSCPEVHQRSERPE